MEVKEKNVRMLETPEAKKNLIEGIYDNFVKKCGFVEETCNKVKSYLQNLTFNELLNMDEEKLALEVRYILINEVEERLREDDIEVNDSVHEKVINLTIDELESMQGGVSEDYEYFVEELPNESEEEINKEDYNNEPWTDLEDDEEEEEEENVTLEEDVFVNTFDDDWEKEEDFPSYRAELRIKYHSCYCAAFLAERIMRRLSYKWHDKKMQLIHVEYEKEPQRYVAFVQFKDKEQDVEKIKGRLNYRLTWHSPKPWKGCYLKSIKKV